MFCSHQDCMNDSKNSSKKNSKALHTPFELFNTQTHMRACMQTGPLTVSQLNERQSFIDKTDGTINRLSEGKQTRSPPTLHTSFNLKCVHVCARISNVCTCVCISSDVCTCECISSDVCVAHEMQCLQREGKRKFLSFSHP